MYIFNLNKHLILYYATKFTNKNINYLKLLKTIKTNVQ